jgi:hypothetical protein
MCLSVGGWAIVWGGHYPSPFLAPATGDRPTPPDTPRSGQKRSPRVTCLERWSPNPTITPPASVSNPESPSRQSLRIVTRPVCGARNPAPTRRRHILLQISAAVPDGLACDLQKYSQAPPTQPLRTAGDRQQQPGLRVGGSTRKGDARKELAPGGHQEQGESRVTVFRAPDWEKSSGAEVAKRYRDCPFGGRVSADADERHLKDSEGSGGGFRGFPQEQESCQ